MTYIDMCFDLFGNHGDDFFLNYPIVAEISLGKPFQLINPLIKENCIFFLLLENAKQRNREKE